MTGRYDHLTLGEWVECRILRRHPGFYLMQRHPSFYRQTLGELEGTASRAEKSRARSGNVLICVRCGGVS